MGHPASSTVGTESFRDLNGRGVVLTTNPPIYRQVKERVELYLYSTSELFVACL